VVEWRIGGEERRGGDSKGREQLGVRGVSFLFFVSNDLLFSSSGRRAQNTAREEASQTGGTRPHRVSSQRSGWRDGWMEGLMNGTESLKRWSLSFLEQQ